ncbi:MULTISPECIES: hypothetical protein [unclassified Nocardioides]|uniref:hypothetical protein n=1 Tax=unclassified Nocardioides TaxID=2615069 RepID=UPI0009EFCAEA|nr:MULTISPECIES: hypothetical protein [unclassified Nocardioides]GAW54588.1 uncharacterized protein (Precursor) [Nocardioides sp. PD653]
MLAVSLGGLALVPAPASAACHVVREQELVNGQVRMYWVKHCDSEGSATPAADSTRPPRDSDWDRACVRQALTFGLDPQAFCDTPVAAVAPTLTPGIVARAFRRLSLPASELVVQPPGGRTLVNFATNFYTENGGFTRTVSLLGRRVVLRIWPAAYGWRFGDGVTRQTVGAGSPYPDLEITHRYLDEGRVSPRVDTTYAAQFRVGGGPWREVVGTVTVPGMAQGLRVVEARPVLVGY